MDMGGMASLLPVICVNRHVAHLPEQQRQLAIVTNFMIARVNPPLGFVHALNIVDARIAALSSAIATPTPSGAAPGGTPPAESGTKDTNAGAGENGGKTPSEETVTAGDPNQALAVIAKGVRDLILIGGALLTTLRLIAIRPEDRPLEETPVPPPSPP